MARFQLRRGAKASVPTSSMLAGEPHFTTDRSTLHVATDATTSVPLVPPIDDLTTLASVASGDFLLMHDIDEAGGGMMEKKITFNNFKTALSIPAGSSDENVAVISGGTAGYPWGTDGTDGVFRMGSSMSWAKDVGDAYVTLDVATVDGGTF